MSVSDTAKDSVKKAAKIAQKVETASKVELPEMVREFAEKGVEQAKENYARFKNAAEETTDLLEDTYMQATRGATEFNMKALEALRANVNANFDYASELLAARTLSEAAELSARHIRQRFETLTVQTRELSVLAQKVASESAEPMKSGMTRAFRFN